jgi:hypothetical protein
MDNNQDIGSAASERLKIASLDKQETGYQNMRSWC